MINKINQKELIEFYKGHNLRDTGKKFNVSNTTISRYLSKLGVARHSNSEGLKLFHKNYPLSPEQNPMYKGGNTHDAVGYIKVLCPGHPRAQLNKNGKRTYVYEHILVWEKANGKPVPFGAVVHHINGIRNDNRPENLQLITSKNEHTKLHNCMRRQRRAG